MIITFIRELRDDIDILRSTWHHVSEGLGMQLQLEEELDSLKDVYFDNYGEIIYYKFIERRRFIRKKHHPGRRVLPPGDIWYELVFDITTYKIENEVDLLNRINELRDEGEIEMPGNIMPGNSTKDISEEKKESA